MNFVIKVILCFLTLPLILARYGVITKNFEFSSLMIFFMGLAMLMSGLREFQQGRKVSGCLYIEFFLFYSGFRKVFEI